MYLRALFQSAFFLKSIFVVSLFILIFIASVSYKHTIALTESTELLVHSYKIQIQLYQVLSYLKDAEAGQRGFIISRDTTFLQPYTAAREKTNKSFYILKTLTADHLQQQYNIDILHYLINLRFALLANSLEKLSEHPINKDLLDINLLKGKDEMDLILNQINKIIDLEMVYFRKHQNKYEDEISFTPKSTLFILLFSLMVFILSYLKINKNYLILRKTNENLLITTESFKHAEEIGEFSSWQWDLDTRKLTFSDNQYRLLRCEPQSFEPSIENFLEFIHPDDRHIFNEFAEQVKNNKNPSNAFFRIIRKDGELRYFKSIARIIDSQEKNILIGINSDITEEHIRNIALEEKNRALIQSNAELASFNHIASHDLQEPLRKIQTFISRISENEIVAMSETGQEYFTKIQRSVNRMRILIDDLLLFSRTNKTEKVFEKTDLNILLESATQDLAQVIQEKKAIIKTVQLPMLEVIPFQIQQLFINLIGNSLKYCKSDISPIIKIDCEKVNANEYFTFKTDTHKKYYKISVADNGLGFEQQYAENIFILFHRLYHISEYPGTGIGLAICKKIAENHDGFIIAEGKPDIGATFIVFLPA